MKNLFNKINLQSYFLIVFITGIVSLLWLLLLPSDPKNAWILGFSKSRIVMLGGMVIVIFASLFLWLKMALDESWHRNFRQRVDKILRKDLFWIIVLILSSSGIVGGFVILSFAFGLTDIYIRSLFLRLTPWAVWAILVSGLNLVYFWYGDFDKVHASLLKLDIKSWGFRYDIAARFLFLIYFFPIIYVILYFALWRSQTDHALALRFMGENNPIELVTFLALFFGGIQGLKLFWSARKRGEAVWVWGFFLVFSLGVLFVAMEEIAWGQQLFDIKTPAGLKEINLQNEITLHNIRGIPGNLGGSVKLFGWIGLIGILLSFNKKFQIIGVSPVLILWFLMIVAFTLTSGFINSILPIGSDYVLLDVISETAEMFVGLASYLYFWLQTRMLAYGVLRKAYARKVTLAQETLIIDLTDGRSVSAPLTWIPRLAAAPEERQTKWELIDNGSAVHWPDLDIKIRIEQLLSGIDMIEDRPLLAALWK